jgi:hypothetical protein
MTPGHGLGLRLVPHAVRPRIGLVGTIANIEKKLNLPYQYAPHYDQGAEGACVGFGYSWMMSILHRKMYDAEWLYNQAQAVDEYPDTPPEQGTSETAGADILIRLGHRRIWGGHDLLPRLKDGIASVKWANPQSPVDDLRIAIDKGYPFGMAIPWYTNFDKPVWSVERGWVIGEGDLGSIRGYHFICGYGARDSFQAFDLVNSWGYNYPLVKMPYTTVEKLGAQGGAFAIITPR